MVVASAGHRGDQPPTVSLKQDRPTATEEIMMRCSDWMTWTQLCVALQMAGYMRRNPNKRESFRIWRIVQRRVAAGIIERGTRGRYRLVFE